MTRRRPTHVMSPRTARPLVALALLGAVIGAAGCRPDFAPFNRLTALRVLGIQAEPPTPLIGESTTLSALVFTPTPDPTLTYHWTWCPLAAPSSDAYACLVKEQEIDDLLHAAGLPPLPAFDLGTGATATFTNSIDPAVFGYVCRNMLPGVPGNVTIDCGAGFSTQVMLTVTTATDSVTAVQTLKLRFPTLGPDLPQPPANANPQLGGLLASLPAGVVPIDDQGTAVLPRAVATPLGVNLDLMTAAEVYPDAGADGGADGGVSTERLFITWFVETGDTHDQRTSFIAPTATTAGTDPNALTMNSWTPAATKTYPAPTAHIFAVLHDNRGGASWTGGLVTLEPSP